MLTDAALKSLKPKDKPYKVTDRDGMYVRVGTNGTISFRYDYRMHGRRETVTFGKYCASGLSLARAREKCIDAKRMVQEGLSPAIEKQRDKRRIKEAKSFGEFGEKWLTAGPMADSTRAMRRSIFERELARSGPGALKAERLARDLGTTKGSFYWHFTDLRDYLTRLIQVWEERAFDGVIAQLDPATPPRARLEQLCMLVVTLRDPSYGGEALEPALRAWALMSPDVAKAVARMDARRLAYLVSLCREAGVEDPDVPRALYALVVGLGTLGLKDAHKVMYLLLHGL